MGTGARRMSEPLPAASSRTGPHGGASPRANFVRASRTTVPILTGLPFGHVPTKVSLPVGRRCQLVVQGRDALIGW